MIAWIIGVALFLAATWYGKWYWWRVDYSIKLWHMGVQRSDGERMASAHRWRWWREDPGAAALMDFSAAVDEPLTDGVKHG